MAKGSEIFKQLLMRGFPAETATRIVSGELPMENAQRVARGQERFDMNEPLYHGGSKDFTEFDAEITSEFGDFGKGIYMSDNPEEVSLVYAHPSDFRTEKIGMQAAANAEELKQLSPEELMKRLDSMDSDRARQYKETLRYNEDGTIDFDLFVEPKFGDDIPFGDPPQQTQTQYDVLNRIASIEAADKLAGDHNGAMYELVLDSDGVVDIKDPIISAEDSKEYYDRAREEVKNFSQEHIEAAFGGHMTEDDVLDEIDYRASALAVRENPTLSKIWSDANKMGINLRIYPGESSWADVRDQVGKYVRSIEMKGQNLSSDLYRDIVEGSDEWKKLPKTERYGDDQDVLPPGAITQELMKGVGIKGVRDTTTPDRIAYGGGAAEMRPGVHTIMFPGSENQIRSPQAAFDPNYRGGNMLGNADPRLLTGVAAAGVGASTLMNQRGSGEPSKPSNPSKPNDYGMMERLAAAAAVQQRGSITNVPMSHREQAKQAWVEQGLRDGTISSNYSGQRLANTVNIAADFLPWVGGAAGSADTYDSLRAGNLGQALIDGGTTLAGAIPAAKQATKAGRGMLDQAARVYQKRKNTRSAKIMEDIVNQVANNK